MSMFQQRYKSKSRGFETVKESRFFRSQRLESSRKKSRTKIFNENRNALNSVNNTPNNEEVQLPTNVENRMTRLLKWKAERDKFKKLEQMKRKPAFVVGVVHHRLYSPSNGEVVKSSALCERIPKHVTSEVPSNFHMGITRATEKRLRNRQVSTKATQNLIKTSNLGAGKEQKKQKEKSIAPDNYKFKPPIELPEILFGRVAPKSMSPTRLSEFMLFKTSKNVNRESNTTGLIKINNKEHVSVEGNKKISNDTRNSSIESVSLKLSCSEDEVSNSSNKSNNKKYNNHDNDNKKEDKELSSNNTKNTFPSINANTSVLSDSLSEPVFLSPYVVSSRGKNNARKEQQLRRGFTPSHSLSNDIPTKDTVMKDLNISIDEEERTAQYFQFLLNKEIDRLNELCKKWIEIKDESEISEDAQYQINQAVGQTNLLISKKFERFRSLVFDCETGKGEMLVTCKDLQGFWDMMYMEVKNCNLRFEKLEKLRLLGWKEEELPTEKPIGKKKITTRKKVVSTKSSSIRGLLTERKREMAQKLSDNARKHEDTSSHILNDRRERNDSNLTVEHKVRRSTLVCYNDKKFTPTKREDKKGNVLHKVQLSETTKIRSPLTIMKISQMCKTPEVQLDNSISYINSDQTPKRGILKQSKELTEVDSATKITHRVNFDGHVHSIQDSFNEKAQVKYDLAVVLTRIDSLDFVQTSKEVPINVGKKLTFDNNSFEESESVHEIQQDTELKCSKDESVTKISSEIIQKEKSGEKATLPKRSLRRQNAIDKSDEKSIESPSFNIITSTSFKEISDDADLDILKQRLQKHVTISEEKDTNEHERSIRVLRNRSIISENTAKSRRSSKMFPINVKESEHKENKTPLKTRRKSCLDVIENNEKLNLKIDLQNLTDNMNSEDDKRRRSARNVKFSEKECNICAESKPVLSMTPHVRRSKTQSSENKRKSIRKQELLSWETPEKPPERVRRSQNKKV